MKIFWGDDSQLSEMPEVYLIKNVLVKNLVVESWEKYFQVYLFLPFSKR